MESSADMSFKCALCAQCFQTEEKLVEHSRKTHPEQHWYKCRRCCYSTTAMAFLIVHRRQHRVEKPFKCQYCPYSTNLSSGLIIHEKIHTGIKSDVPNFASSSTRRKMMDEFEQNRDTDRNICSFDSAREKFLPGVEKINQFEEGPYKCESCSYSTKLRDCFKNHELVHLEKKPFKCDKCSYSGALKRFLGTHKRIHRRRKRRRYRFNGSNLADDAILKDQKNVGCSRDRSYSAAAHRPSTKVCEEIRAGQRYYKCRYCTFSSRYVFSLKRHGRTHTGERPYKCRYCSYSASRKYTLVCHEYTHTGKRPYQCKNCSYAAAKRSTLTAHEKTHTGVKPYQCKNCSYAAAKKSALTCHERYHTGDGPYKCRFCSYSTTNMRNLKRHEGTHTEEIHYKCRYCSYSAANLSGLKSHKSTHAEERSYSSRYCSYRSTRNTSLKGHERTHLDEGLQKCQTQSYPANRSNLSIISSKKSDRTDVFIYPVVLSTVGPTYLNRLDDEVSSKIEGKTFHESGCSAFKNLQEVSEEDRDCHVEMHLCRECKYHCGSGKELCMHYSNNHKLPVVYTNKFVIHYE